MQIKTSRGQEAIIDDSDFPIVSQFKWYATPAKMGGYYAATHVAGTTVYMHRLIVGAPKGKEVDHYNHNTLDNRRENLKVGSHKDNMGNAKYALATHCPRGHEYNEANTHINKKGDRLCRACAALRQSKIYASETPQQRETRRQRVKDHWKRNKEKIRAANNAYAAAHREQKREYDRLRRERLKQL